jgi:hypothetical protein
MKRIEYTKYSASPNFGVAYKWEWFTVVEVEVHIY